MNKDNEFDSKTFRFLSLNGSSYEIGSKLAEYLKKNPSAPEFYSSGKPNLKKLGFRNFIDLQEYYESYIPGLAEETQGFIDALSSSSENALIYGFPHSFQNNCSHMVALPSITQDEKILVGRSYEWDHNEEDLILCTTKVNGKAKHIGFTMLLFGRYEGLNDHGVCVTSSGGGAYSTQDSTKGIPYSLAIKSVLENCKTAEEAVNYLIDIPNNSTNNYIICDKRRKAFLIECLNSEYSVKEIDNSSKDQYLISTNHLTLPDKIKFNEKVNSWLLPNSTTRYNSIEKVLCENKNQITKETIRNILSTEIPEGVCAYYYSWKFGTIYSMIFDVIENEVEISFGPPSHNEWIKFNLEMPSESSEHKAIFPLKDASKGN
ncbi:MAG: C45 family autoproteolytic acyltransferase/hydrolase [Candidatus Heimdallarchaeaceae archaeon]|jgi:predicted choloylglycine hydrolase